MYLSRDTKAIRSLRERHTLSWLRDLDNLTTFEKGGAMTELATMPETERVQAQDQPDRVYYQLRELIVSGRLAPGTRLVEAIAAQRLGVSRTPVRSALQRLQQEGYAVPLNEGDERTRLVVASMTADDAADLFYVVGELEGLAGHYAANMKPDDRAHLADGLEALNGDLLTESHARPPDAYRAFQLDTSFHRRYVAEAAPPRLLALHNTIKPQAERYARLYVVALTNELDVSVAEHDAIVRAIRDGDGAAAQRAIQTNWRNAAKRIGRVITEWGGSGGW
jgi:DNA-binding GntR family transcriptional regulator